MAAAMFATGLAERRWPSERRVIEALAYGAGFFGGVSLLTLSVDPGALSKVQEEAGWQFFAGGLVLAYASLRGALNVVGGGHDSHLDEEELDIEEEDPPATGTEGSPPPVATP
jgi:hypothetical protein